MTPENSSSSEPAKNDSPLERLKGALYQLLHKGESEMRQEATDRKAEVALVEQTYASLILRIQEIVEICHKHDTTLQLEDDSTLEMRLGLGGKTIQLMHTRPSVESDTDGKLYNRFYHAVDYIHFPASIRHPDVGIPEEWVVRNCTAIKPDDKNSLARWKGYTTSYPLNKPKVGAYGQGWEEATQQMEVVAGRVAYYVNLLQQAKNSEGEPLPITRLTSVTKI